MCNICLLNDSVFGKPDSIRSVTIHPFSRCQMFADNRFPCAESSNGGGGQTVELPVPTQQQRDTLLSTLAQGRE